MYFYSELAWKWCVTGQWTTDTAYLHSRNSGRRIAFLSLYIDTVMNAKFGKGAYTLSLHFQTGMFGRKTLTIH